MRAAEAIAKVEQWLRAGNPVDLTRGEHAVRVDHENLLRIPEGWFVPYDAVRALDGGERLAALVPKPALIVREDGSLRHPDPGPDGTGPSIAVAVAGQDDWQEIVEPEFARSGVAHLGVPAVAVMAWRKRGPQGGEIRVNPDYRLGPERLGHPAMDTTAEQLLGCWETGRFDRPRYLAGLLSAELYYPVDHRTGQPLYGLWQENPRTLRVFTSRRRLPPGTSKWVRTDVLSFVAEFPGTGLAINPGAFPSDVVTAVELTRTRARWPEFRAAVRVVEVSPEYSQEVAAAAEAIRAELGLAEAVSGLQEAAGKARAAGFELSTEDCERFVRGRAWEQRNRAAHAGVDSPDDDLSGQRWPADLRANGLVAGYDAAGRIRPHAVTSGKFFRQDADGTEFAWHRVAGAFAGFAIGESLGSAVDTMSLPEIRARYGEDGILEPTGTIGPLTRQLLFHTEGLMRGLPARFSGAAPGGLMALGALSSQRWQDAQRGERDGWLSQVPLLCVPGEAAPSTGDDVAFLVPGMVAALCGGGPESDVDTVAQVGRLLAAGGGADGPTAEAAGAMAELFSQLFRRGEPLPPHTLLQRIVGRGPARGPVTDALANAVRARTELVRTDPEELDGAGRGDTAVDALGRAMIAVSRRFFDAEWAIQAAVGHSGRSAITGAIAGAVVGSRVGIPGLPSGWLDRLEAADLVETVAGDAFWHFSAQSPSTDQRYAAEWARRYPRT
ncbi:ADP-ribosylglycohydrolase family protein [Amycolatopsis sp. NPDC051071]|uniref:ADP-ribosylglycohydrolase family protein n=1 Tax=Amycolatopsis sp. NPDC051071 TaxID=3154637 RepID=UPI00341BF60E